MKAVVQDRYGSAQVLRLCDVEVPTPDERSVLVKVSAASINALDWRILSGRPVLIRLFGVGLLRPKRPIRGVDVAGRVEMVRRSDSRFKVGDEVFGLGSGTFAEYVAADESELQHKPPSVPFLEASTLGVAAFTALQALRDVAHVRTGQRVHITAAGSGVGTFAVQLAKWMGARVTAVTSSKNLELAHSIGADEVLDYTKVDFTRRAERFHAILDISGIRPMRACRRLLLPGGLLVVVGGRGMIGLLLKPAILHTVLRYPVRSMMAKPRVDDLRLLGELVAQGHLRPVIDRTFPLTELPAAMAYAMGHQVSGKIAITVAGA